HRPSRPSRDLDTFGGLPRRKHESREVVAVTARHASEAQMLTRQIATEGLDDGREQLEPDLIRRRRPAHRVADAVDHLRSRKPRQAVKLNLIANVASAAIIKP